MWSTIGTYGHHGAAGSYTLGGDPKWSAVYYGSSADGEAQDDVSADGISEDSAESHSGGVRLRSCGSATWVLLALPSLLATHCDATLFPQAQGHTLSFRSSRIRRRRHQPHEWRGKRRHETVERSIYSNPTERLAWSLRAV